ncbi:6103_t:CDS:2 [Paraglomus occultum]|uniref:Transcription initiation factor IIE subunit beta n=1 Tax=Paraglomus occultum TaxID=144539 RepID=A0A9N9G9E8_9GLOM|nr:6103_t:CDS:2 [Paraglomus occultum]
MSSLAQTAQFSEKSRLHPDPRSRASTTQLLTPHNVSAKAEPSTSSKKKNKKPVYSQPADTGTVKHTLSQLHKVINFLKERVDSPQSAEDLKNHQIADITANDELYKLMINNEKIEYDAMNGTFKYKPEFMIRSSEDLLQLLYERKDSKPCGMHFKDLADSYVDVTTSIQELEKESRILVIRLMKDNSPRLMFWNDVGENTTMDKEFVDMFHKVKTPDDVDLKVELQKAGLQTMAILENKATGEIKPKQRKRKQGNRKIKITNTHLDLDLTKDYTPMRS